MLTILGFVMIATFLVLIMMKKMSPMGALVLIPALFCVLVGKGAHLGTMSSRASAIWHLRPPC
ncbi:hypothetical protein SVIO_030520 [Streptomyces violaceusniger]|uniref:Citrate transporter-like domain-containing protein n=1 Tax=Streptomyces violaceusniger TaxID=68280 RepID=A0A4D4L310_STRVO|nr:hypothetical protein SVIO_030520 [Streptomyces violaceusniger]